MGCFGSGLEEGSMRVPIIAALAALTVVSVSKADQDHRRIGSVATACDNDGHCSTFNEIPGAADARKRGHVRAAERELPSAATDANGNTAGLVISHKTGARARVGVAY